MRQKSWKWMGMFNNWRIEMKTSIFGGQDARPPHRCAGFVVMDVVLPICIGSLQAEEAGKKLTVGMMPKQVGIDYFNAVEKGAKEAAQEIGAELIWDGPTDNDVSKQAEMIDTWIARKVDVIAVAPND